MRNAIGLVCLTIGLWWLTAPAASAALYDVYGCRLPNGTAIAASGWQPYTQGAAGFTSNSCSKGGGLTGTMDESKAIQEGSLVGWMFEAPRDTTIENYTLHRSSRTSKASPEDRGRSAWLYHDAAIYDTSIPSRYAQTACPPLFGCSGEGDPRSPFAVSNRYQSSKLQILRVFYLSRCDGPSQCSPSGPASVTIWASRMGIADPYNPTFQRDPSGAFTRSGPVLAGEHAVTFAATDRGSGIASVAFVVDGTALEQLPAQPTATSCRRPYVHTVPCPLKVERTIVLDTTRIANGSHILQIALTDAAGNRTLSPPAQVEIRNRGVPNGAGATQFARLDAWFATRGSSRPTRTVVSFGRSREIAGRLTAPDGTPIAGATLDVAATVARPGSSARRVGQVVTDANGAFRYSPTAGSSRRFTVSYRAFTLDEAAAAIGKVTMRTRASVALAVSPRRVSARGVARFRGRLRGGPGRQGTQVVIYALGGPRSRIPVTTVRANSRGLFTYRYRFRNSSPGTTYRFRATLHAQRGYPYAAASSPPVALRIR